MSELDNLKRKIAKKEPVIGTCTTFFDSRIAELIGEIGYDFVWIDAEHGPLDKKDIQLHIMAAQSTGAAAFVRVAWNDPVIVKPILEMGPSGIIFPFIKTAEEASKAISSCTYPPKGIRGFGPIRSMKYGMTDGQTYIEEASSQIWKIIQIEHIDAVKNLDEILRVEGIDAIIIGANDLSGSIGMLGQTGRKEVKELIDTIVEKAQNSGIPVGVAIGDNVETIKENLNRGINLICVGVDFLFLFKSARQTYNDTRRLFKSMKT